MGVNTAISINKYANETLDRFNKKYRTQFNCILGLNGQEIGQSTLNNKTKTIRVDLPKSCLGDPSYENMAAVQILLGHELAHHIYDNMSMSSLDVLTMCTDRLAGQYRKLIMSCCIETAADIHGKNMFKLGGGIATPEVYSAYMKLIQGGEVESVENIVSGLKSGYLPASYRIKLMKSTDNFKQHEYAIVDNIYSDVYYIAKNYMHKRIAAYKYLDWIKLQMKMDNFSNRPNRQ